MTQPADAEQAQTDIQSERREEAEQRNPDPTTFETLTPDAVDKQVEGLENSARSLASQLVEPTDNFQIGVGEALKERNPDLHGAALDAAEGNEDGTGRTLG